MHRETDGVRLTKLLVTKDWMAAGLPPHKSMRLDLSATRFCSQLSPADVTVLQEASRICRFPIGSEVFSEGDPGDGLYVILEGTVDIVSKIVGGNTYMLSRMERGDYFGEMAVFDGEPRSATAVVKEAVEAVFVPVEAVQHLMERSRAAGRMLVRDASLRLREFNQRFLHESLRAERLTLVERLARGIAHDFRNPLTVIALAGEMAASDTATAMARREASDRIQKHVAHLNQMMQELVDFTRGTQPTLVLPKVNYADFLRDALMDLHAAAARRGIRLVVEGEPPATRLRLDSPRLVRVFMNLSQNAFDAMTDLPDPILRIRFSVTPSYVVTEFVDNGRGVEPENLPRLFEPFFTHGKAQGTGLGLAICERIVQDHGGTITAHSEEGNGATFTVMLPLSGPERPNWNPGSVGETPSEAQE